ncbi:MAG: 2-C-methyl-D-erythritol 4-phosphate cytidylyltransferase, partial [Clostridia bacterium]|nr:2-C-methyl-D-erythritol 4-phosphate cytidylyltransferase [Clostridia bacterium]
MIFAAILAGGVGSRMNIADMPKQFLPLKAKPIIIHTLEKFILNDRFDKIYIGVHPNWLLYMKDLLKKYNLQIEKIKILPGGLDRTETILNIIKEIKADVGGTNLSEHILVTHDSVRPFVTSRIINDNIDAASRFGACNTVVQAIDTIVVSEDADTVKSIPQRSLMYLGQTPQSFNLELIIKLYDSISESDKATLTDACKVCVLKNIPVKLVRGEYSNFKITTITDYKM